MKTFTSLIILSLAVGAFSVCLPGFSSVGGKCYIVPGLPTRFSWWSSSELCSVIASNLFRVTTQEEWSLLNDFLTSLGYTDTYWTGISAEGHPGQWVIRDSGTELNLDAVEFKEGAPSNSATNLCLAIEWQTALQRYQWVDVPCSNEYVVVCEPKRCLY